tara:strand:- start:5459 stop:6550 length:1092 start_codon:yes stop_codon:yes gene_type:complete
MKILYIVSTLKNSGPVNQLFNVVKFINGHQVIILTLSPEVDDSRIQDFINIGVTVHSLSLNRIKGLLYGSKKTLDFIEETKPDIIHTQGIRADGLLFSLKQYRSKWVSTIHNYPKEDYPMKFGMLKGGIMALKHLKFQRKCSNNIACSNYISNILDKHNICSYPIQNGSDVLNDNTHKGEIGVAQNARFITVGSLIPRKNMIEIIRTFNVFLSESNSSLTILGDGPEMEELQRESSNERIIFKGNVDNVDAFLSESHFFLSASLSEGLPNTVLEAMSNGLPCILSKIPSHLEFSDQKSSGIRYFDLSLGSVNYQLLEILRDYSLYEGFSDDSEKIKSIHREKFSSAVMSNNYLNFYTKVLDRS